MHHFRCADIRPVTTTSMLVTPNVKAQGRAACGVSPGAQC